MKRVRRTYGIAPDTVRRFESVVEPGSRSRVVSDLIANWVEVEEKSQLRALVIEGCEVMGEDNLEIANEKWG